MKQLMKTILLTAAAMKLSLAFAAVPPIPCPPVEFIKQHLADVDTVQEVTRGRYAVFTGMSFTDSSSDRLWQAGSDVSADNYDTALAKGRKNIEQAAYPVHKYAEYLRDFWLCLYSDNEKTAVYVTSKINFNTIHKAGNP